MARKKIKKADQIILVRVWVQRKFEKQAKKDAEQIMLKYKSGISTFDNN